MGSVSGTTPAGTKSQKKSTTKEKPNPPKVNSDIPGTTESKKEVEKNKKKKNPDDISTLKSGFVYWIFGYDPYSLEANHMKVYVGQTKLPLQIRMDQHIGNYNRMVQGSDKKKSQSFSVLDMPRVFVDSTQVFYRHSSELTFEEYTQAQCFRDAGFNVVSNNNREPYTREPEHLRLLRARRAVSLYRPIDYSSTLKSLITAPPSASSGVYSSTVTEHVLLNGFRDNDVRPVNNLTQQFNKMSLGSRVESSSNLDDDSEPSIGSVSSTSNSESDD